MKGIAKRSPAWPARLDGMRSLCTFYKNDAWRGHVAKAAMQRGYSSKRLVHFSVGFAKWRYETIHAVTEALADLRAVSEQVVQLEMFNNPQDRASVEEACKHCHDLKFQRWAAITSRHLWTPLEVMRRWGMVCDCEKHVQQRLEGKTHIHCPRNSRKLRSAWTYIEDQIAAIKENLDNLTEEHVEGDHELFMQLHGDLTQCAALLELRFKYLKQVPWSFADADNEEGAKTALLRLGPTRFTNMTHLRATSGGGWRRTSSQLRRVVLVRRPCGWR